MSGPILMMDSDVVDRTEADHGFGHVAVDGRRWCRDGFVRLDAVVLLNGRARAGQMMVMMGSWKSVGRVAADAGHEDGLIVVMDSGSGAQIEDGRLDESHGHLAVHLLLGDPVAVPIDEEEDGPRSGHFRRQEPGHNQLETVSVRVGEEGRLVRRERLQFRADLGREDGHVDDQSEEQKKTFEMDTIQRCNSV